MGVCQVFLHSIFNKVRRYNLHIIEFIDLLQIYGYSFDINIFSAVTVFIETN
jgi:hypothetical protein